MTGPEGLEGRAKMGLEGDLLQNANKGALLRLLYFLALRTQTFNISFV